MRILLFSAICFCFVHGIVAADEDLSDFERAALTELEEILLTRGVEETDRLNVVVDSEAQEVEAETAEKIIAALENLDDAEGSKTSATNQEQLQFLSSPKKSCCDRRVSFVDLRNYKPKFNIPKGSYVQQMQSNGGQKEKCTSAALLKVNFQKVVGNCTTGCLKKPACGRRMLKIQLELDVVTKRSGFMFNVGDSSTNNGYGGDMGTQKCDAEVHARYPYVLAYGSDKCKTPNLATLPEILKTANKFVTLYVSNEHTRITNDIGFETTLCSRCLFCLDGQQDNNQNEDIYIGLNRVVQSTYRRGTGVCTAALSWECPCSDW